MIFFEDQSRTNIPDLVEFNHKKSNRESTRYIAELVSKGIELEQIIHNDLREFRHWHFDVKKSNPVEVSISISACLDYQRYISHINDMEREDSAFREYIAPVTEKISSQLRERASRDQYIDSIC